MGRVPFVCPETRAPLERTDAGLRRADGRVYPFVPGADDVPDFLVREGVGEGGQASLDMYDSKVAGDIYRNFLDWLFATFRASETDFRREMIGRLGLKPGDAVLITGCGLGDDVPHAAAAVGPGGEVHAQDLSPAMAKAAQAATPELGATFSAGDAARLPYADGVFDAAFHFGGINLFDDVKGGIAEMARVVRPGGRVVVSDEGVAPWLRGTDYAAMVITNNRLWAHEAPLGFVPQGARNTTLSWVLGDCFWVIAFEKGEGAPAIDPNVIHKGRRGGSMWTRHTGQLEAVTPETREKVAAAAAAAGLSVHDWLEQALGEALK